MSDQAIPSTLLLEVGDSLELPGGYGTIEFSGIDRFVALDVRHDPAIFWVLVTSLAAIFGLIGSLFTPRRRVWVRATPQGEGRTLVAVAGLTRHEDLGLETEITAFVTRLRTALTDDEDVEGK